MLIHKARISRGGNANSGTVKLIEKNMLLVNFHSMMGKYTFDQKRMMECVHQWIADDEKLYPFCSYLLFHNEKINEELNKYCQ